MENANPDSHRVDDWSMMLLPTQSAHFRLRPIPKQRIRPSGPAVGPSHMTSGTCAPRGESLGSWTGQPAVQ